MKVRNLKPGHTFVLPPTPSAGLTGGTYTVASVSTPYMSPNGHTSSEYVRVKVLGGDTGPQPYLADAEVKVI